MSVRAHLALGDDALVVQKDDEDMLFMWHIDNRVEKLNTPHGAKDWLELGRVMHGLARVMDADGNFSPVVGPKFPTLKPKTLDGGEVVYVVS